MRIVISGEKCILQWGMFKFFSLQIVVQKLYSEQVNIQYHISGFDHLLLQQKIYQWKFICFPTQSNINSSHDNVFGKSELEPGRLAGYKWKWNNRRRHPKQSKVELGEGPRVNCRFDVNCCLSSAIKGSKKYYQFPQPGDKPNINRSPSKHIITSDCIFLIKWIVGRSVVIFWKCECQCFDSHDFPEEFPSW